MLKKSIGGDVKMSILYNIVVFQQNQILLGS